MSRAGTICFVCFLLTAWSARGAGSASSGNLSLNAKGVQGRQKRERKYNINWYHEGRITVRPKVESEKSYVGKNHVGLNYKIKDKQNLSFRLSFLNRSKIANDLGTWQLELGDGHIQYKDKTFIKEGPFGLRGKAKHRLYIPLRKRNKERGLITRYKGEVSLIKGLPRGWELSLVAVPSFFWNRSSTYYKKKLTEDGQVKIKTKANPHWEWSDVLEVARPISEIWTFMGSFGHSYRKYHDLNNRQELSRSVDVGLWVGFKGITNGTIMLGIVHNHDVEADESYEPYNVEQTSVAVESNFIF